MGEGGSVEGVCPAQLGRQQLAPCSPKLQPWRGPYLDGRHKGKVANENDAQLCGHVLHDGPALIA